MNCNILTSAINATCPETPKGFERVGFLFDYDEIAATRVVTNNTVKWSKGVVPTHIFDRSKKPFLGTTVTSEESAHGFTIFSDTVGFYLLKNNPENALLVETFAQRKFVLVLENKTKGINDDARWVVYGAMGGLTLSEAIQENTDDVAWGIKMMDRNTGKAGLFFYDTDLATTSATTDLWKFEIQVRGLIFPISTNKTITYTPTTVTAKLVFADGTVYTGVSGTITFSTAVQQGGAIIGDFTGVGINQLNLTGELYSNVDIIDCYNNNITSLDLKNATYINTQGCLISSIISPNVITLYASGNALPSSVIESLLLSIVNTGKNGGSIVISGGTNAAYADWTQAAKDAKATLVSRGWSITNKEP